MPGSGSCSGWSRRRRLPISGGGATLGSKLRAAATATVRGVVLGGALGLGASDSAAQLAVDRRRALLRLLWRLLLGEGVLRHLLLVLLLGVATTTPIPVRSVLYSLLHERAARSCGASHVKQRMSQSSGKDTPTAQCADYLLHTSTTR